MFIKEIQLENFGPIEHQRFPLCENKINVIFGDNAMGKTQLLAAVYSVFFGSKLLQYHQNSEQEGYTYLRVHLADENVDLIQQHTSQTSQILLKDFADIEKLSKINRENLFFYFPDLERTNQQKYTRSDIQNVQRFLWNLGLKEHHILGSCLAKTEINVVMSSSEKRYLDFVCLLSKIPAGSILIADGILAGMDETMCYMIIDILSKLKGVQLILAENRRLESIFTQQNINTLYLLPPSRQTSPVSYNYQIISHNMPNTGAADTGDSIEPVLYRTGDLFPYGENPAIELKEIKGNRPCNSIIANAEIYVNAYLNSSLQETGKIFWGIANDRTITGVRLSYEEIDTIQRKISEVLSQAEPYVSPDLYNIKFNKIATASGEVQPDTYIVEVDVFPYPSDWLYATSKGEVFIKTPGGKRKLSNLQIQEQILLRRSRSRGNAGERS